MFDFFFRMMMVSFVICTSCHAIAQDDETAPPELLPGLVAEYSVGGTTISRVDPAISFAGVVRGEGEPHRPDERLPSGEFRIRWTGKLRVAEQGEYRLSIFSAGAVSLAIDGVARLSAESDIPDWQHAAPLELPFGVYDIAIDYESPPAATPAVALFWSGPSFGLEPLGERFLSHASERTVDNERARGHALSRGLRCNACHEFPQPLPQPLAAPALTHLDGNLRPGWLVERLTYGHEQLRGEASWRMPHFTLDPDDAAAISAALFAASEKSAAAEDLAQQLRQLARSGNARDVEIRAQADSHQGELVFASKGCIACHQSPDVAPRLSPTSRLFSGGDLSTISRKRTADFYVRWLTDPGLVNAHHRMPRFELTLQERHDLAAYLASLGAESSSNSEPITGDSALGARLIQRHRCGACHQLPRALVFELVAMDKTRVDADSQWSAGCLGPPDPREYRPGFALDGSDRSALRAFLASPEATFKVDTAEQLIAENNCLACHSRGLEQGIAAHFSHLAEALPDLAPRLAAVAPPSLSSVGDKLHDEALINSVARNDAPRRPWLDVQMPRFRFSDEQLRRIADAFVSHDRIPEGSAPALKQSQPQAQAQAASEEDAAVNEKASELAAGRLVTADGFGCQSCHQIADSQPHNVALNAHGSDLTMLGQRIRASWFERWVQNPARIVPRMEMPAIQVAAKGILHDSLDAQLDALWQTLNTPGFRPPTANPVRVVRNRNDPSISPPTWVLTDFLDMPERSFLRPLIFGPPNRHNLMFDLETAQLAGWWLGDTAHQHTRGKSWYWNAGAPSLVETDYLERLELIDSAGARWRPTISGQVAVELDAISHEGSTAAWSGTLHLADEQGRRRQVTLAQRVEAMGERGVQLHSTLGSLESGDVLQIVSAARWNSGRASHVAHFDELNRAEFSTSEEPGFSRAGDRLALPLGKDASTISWSSRYVSELVPDRIFTITPAAPASRTVTLDCVPGFTTTKLPLPMTEMPISLAWGSAGELFVGSLKGRVLQAVDTDADGLQDHYRLISDELPTPYGLHANADGTVDALAKFALLRLTPPEGYSDTPPLRNSHELSRLWDSRIIADGWGYTSDYHDWAVGLEKDQQGNYWMALPCQQDDRSEAAAYMRGQSLRLVPNPDSADRRLFRIETFAAGLRFPMGLALDDADRLFTSDNQGNYNPFNELNHVREGKRYGFINKLESKPGFSPPYESPAVNLPHPWTRSVNGICFLRTPSELRAAGGTPSFGPFEGHLLGCEMNGRSLIRMSLQQVDGEYQGAAYLFSRPVSGDEPTFEGPIVCEVSPEGDIYVGNLQDSGWGGGQNTGSIVRLSATDELPLGIAEMRATPTGFEIDFTQQVDPLKANELQNYSIRSYQRIATPAYGGEDQDERAEAVQAIEVSDDRRRVTLTLPALRAGFVYELNIGPIGLDDESLFPSQAHYTLRSIP